MSNETIKPVKLRKRPTRVLPTDRMAFQRQLDALRAYAIHGDAGKPVTNEQVAGTLNISPGTVSLCNPFFADVQLIQRAEGGYLPGPEVIAFNHALSWNSETAAYKLAPLLQRTWFANALIPRIRFRALDEKEAITCLAEASSAEKEYEPQLRTLLDYLSAAGLIFRDNGMIKVASLMSAPPIPENKPVQPEKPTPNTVQGSDADRVMPIPLGRGRLARVELPDDWDSVKDLDRFLKMLRLSLSEEPEEIK